MTDSILLDAQEVAPTQTKKSRFSPPPAYFLDRQDGSLVPSISHKYLHKFLILKSGCYKYFGVFS